MFQLNFRTYAIFTQHVTFSKGQSTLQRFNVWTVEKNILNRQCRREIIISITTIFSLSSPCGNQPSQEFSKFIHNIKKNNLQQNYTKPLSFLLTYQRTVSFAWSSIIVYFSPHNIIQPTRLLQTSKQHRLYEIMWRTHNCQIRDTQTDVLH